MLNVATKTAQHKPEGRTTCGNMFVVATYAPISSQWSPRLESDLKTGAAME